MARILVAVAWPYANGPCHIGHLAGAYLPGDVFARFHRLRGDEVLMVSGSDMHGTPILVTAEREGKTPSEVAEHYHAVNAAAFRQLGFSFDLFTTTHTVVHERTVAEVFLALLENGYLRRGTEENPYCPKDQRFLPDRYLVGTCPHCGFEGARGDECDHCGRPIEIRTLIHPTCALCGTPAEFRLSEHFYLRLDALEPKLRPWVEAQRHWRAGTVRVAQNFLAEGLHPTPITRDLEWGVPVPLDGYESKRIYVWFEALIGYLSASKEWAIRSGRPEAWHRYWDLREPVRAYYFIGKDNKFHHTIFWPGILFGVGGLQLPFDVPANEWMLVGGEKPSKSRTRDDSVFLPALLERFPPDEIRFYATLLAPQNRDTEFDAAEFRSVREEILANQYGNLVQRALVLVREREGGRVPTPPSAWSPERFASALRTPHERITEEYEHVRLKEALDLALTEVREANRRFHEAKPWQASDDDRRSALYETVWRLRALATWLAPVLPFSSAEVFRMLGFPDPPGPGDWERVLEPPTVGQPLGEVRPLFPRSNPPGKGSAAEPPAESGEPAPLELRSAVIVRAENHPSADRLYVLTLDDGSPTPRTVVAGLRSSYAADALKGQPVLVLTNLAPRTIRKVTSQGMVLAAALGERAVLLVPPAGIAPGTLAGGSVAGSRTISHEEFERYPLIVGRVEEPLASSTSRVQMGDRSVTVPGNWPPGAVLVVRITDSPGGKGDVLAFDNTQLVGVAEAVPPGTRVR